MKRFIKEHPWWLEIVPFLLLAFYISIEIALGSMARNPLLPFMVLCWCVQISINHNWVKAERGQKRFNKSARSMLFAIWVFGYSGFEHAATWMVISWVAAVPLGWVAQLKLEASRRALTPDVLQAEEIAPEADDIGIDDKLYYREMPPPWGGVSLTIVSGLLITLSVWSLTRRWWAAVAYFILFTAPFVAFLFRRTFVITNEKITVRLGINGISIPMASVLRCGIQEYSPVFTPYKYGATFKTYDGMRLFAWLVPPKYALVVEKTDGERSLFTPVQPQKACNLINVILAARAGQEAQQ
jgi:hypothetical protein